MWEHHHVLAIAVELNKLLPLELQILLINLMRLIYFLGGCFLIVGDNLLPDSQVIAIDLLYLV